MTYEQYWFGDPHLVKYYEKAHELSNEQKNQEMFVMANYVFEAFSTALSNLNFGKTYKAPNKFRDKPYDLRPDTKKRREQKAQEAREKVIADLTAWKQSWDKKNKK